MIDVVTFSTCSSRVRLLIRYWTVSHETKYQYFKHLHGLHDGQLHQYLLLTCNETPVSAVLFLTNHEKILYETFRATH